MITSARPLSLGLVASGDGPGRVGAAPAIRKKGGNEIALDMPVLSAARTLLKRKLKAVRKAVGPAREQRGDADHKVHQLRVATRRAQMALWSFRSCVSKQSYKKVRRTLREIRRLAGAIRACDVHSRILKEALTEADAADRAALEHAILRCNLDGRRARESFIAGIEHIGARSLKKLARKACGRQQPETGIGDRRASALATHAARVVGTLAERFTAAGQGDLESGESLHRLRIACKKLRYAIEIFESAGARFMPEQLHPQLQVLQDRLGEFNDDAEVSQRLRRYAAELTGALKNGHARSSGGLRASLKSARVLFAARADQARSRFLDWWRSEEALQLRVMVDQVRAAGAQGGQGRRAAHAKPVDIVILRHDRSAAAQKRKAGNAADAP